MQIDKQTEKLMREMQVLEQSLQQVLMEKQALKADLNESSNALEEVKKTGDEVYQVLGNIMLKAKKEEIIKNLDEKIKLSGLRIKSIENQEKSIEQRIEGLRKDITKLISEKKS